MCAGVRHKQARPSAAPVWCLVCRNKRSVDRQAGVAQSRSRMTMSSSPRTTAGAPANRGRRAAKSTRHDWRPKAQSNHVGGHGVSIQGPAMRPGGIRVAPCQMNPADPLSTKECEPLAREFLVGVLPLLLLARSAAASSAVAGRPQSKATARVRGRSSVPVDRGSTCRRASLRIDRSHKAKRGPRSIINHLFPQPAELL